MAAFFEAWRAGGGALGRAWERPWAGVLGGEDTRAGVGRGCTNEGGTRDGDRHACLSAARARHDVAPHVRSPDAESL